MALLAAQMAMVGGGSGAEWTSGSVLTTRFNASCLFRAKKASNSAAQLTLKKVFAYTEVHQLLFINSQMLPGWNKHLTDYNSFVSVHVCNTHFYEWLK